MLAKHIGKWQIQRPKQTWWWQLVLLFAVRINCPRAVCPSGQLIVWSQFLGDKPGKNNGREAPLRDNQYENVVESCGCDWLTWNV